MKLNLSYSKCKNIIVSFTFPSRYPSQRWETPSPMPTAWGAHSVGVLAASPASHGNALHWEAHGADFLAPAPGCLAPCSTEKNQLGVQEEGDGVGKTVLQAWRGARPRFLVLGLSTQHSD